MLTRLFGQGPKGCVPDCPCVLAIKDGYRAGGGAATTTLMGLGVIATDVNAMVTNGTIRIT
jgi:hypothetical protein